MKKYEFLIKAKTFCLLFLILILASCAQKGPPVDVDDVVIDPSNNDESVVQVVPMVPQAVKQLIKEAEMHKINGETQLAIELLHRARTISPGSPMIHQQLAETYLADGNYELALNWSKLVVNNGPKKGSLCERSRRTVAIAAEYLQQTAQQEAALNAVESCVQPKLNRY